MIFSKRAEELYIKIKEQRLLLFFSFLFSVAPAVYGKFFNYFITAY